MTKSKTTTVATSSDLFGAVESVMDSVGFSLCGKINGRIVSFAMRAVAADERSAKAVSTIDGYNDAMAELDQLAANTEFFSNAGRESDTMPAVEVLAKWLAVREELSNHFNVASQPLIENFKFILERAASANDMTADQLEQLSTLSGVNAASVQAARAKKNEADFGRTKERVLKSIQLIADTGVDHDVSSIQEDINDVILDAVGSAKKAAVKTANNTDEALASLILLKSIEDTL